jgi:hypothetical protein
VFVAAAIVTFWRRTKPSKLSTTATAAAAPAASTPRKSKAQRKARAS